MHDLVWKRSQLILKACSSMTPLLLVSRLIWIKSTFFSTIDSPGWCASHVVFCLKWLSWNHLFQFRKKLRRWQWVKRYYKRELLRNVPAHETVHNLSMCAIHHLSWTYPLLPEGRSKNEHAHRWLRIRHCFSWPEPLRRL